MATELADQLPSIGTVMQPTIPHTRASFKIQVDIWNHEGGQWYIQDIIPKSHLASFTMSENDMKLITHEDFKETEKLIDEKKGHRQRFGLLVRAIDAKR